MSRLENRIRLGISTCPNDTFTFHALLNRLVDWQGLEFEIQLLDIQQLNERLFAQELDVAKASFHAALLVADKTIVLPSGSALGFGVGPLLLAAESGTEPTSAEQVTLCPGETTTATLLFRMFYPNTTGLKHVVFSEIMPELQVGRADFGVCIHEGRFTWASQGLSCVADLGEKWESATGHPLPLGGLLADRSLPVEVATKVQSVILDSLQYSRNDPTSALPTMRKYAQEFSDDVLMQHVDLYVNDWTVDLGETGTLALQELSARARKAGIVRDDHRGLEVFSLPS